MTVLSVEGLKTHFFTRAGVVRAVDGVDFALERGEIMGLVGESGSGKSVTGFSILGLVDAPGRVVGGKIVFQGEDLARIPESRMRTLRGAKVAMIFQDPMMTLNPVLRIDTQMVEAVLAHRKMSRREAWTLARDGLARVGIPSPEQRLRAYPHQLSGGMRQRVAIAVAFLNDPDLLIADEPTTALDVTIQAQIVHVAQTLCRDRGAALIWITHDLAVVAGLADRVAVMYAGRIVEAGPTDDVIDGPRHPYTVGLLGSVPSANRRGGRLAQIPGMTPDMLAMPDGCAFRERCPRGDAMCGSAPDVTVAAGGHAVRCFHPHDGEARA